MEEEAKGLSKLVEKQLQEYNKEILDSSAILMDADICNCVFCLITIFLELAGLNPSCAICAACVAAAGLIWFLILGCIAVCTFCIVSAALLVSDCYLCAIYLGLL